MTSLEATALFISTFLTPISSVGVAVGLMFVFYFLGVFWSSMAGPIQGIRYASIFYYYNPREMLINGVMDNVLRDTLVLSGYSGALVIASVTIFSRHDIPV